MIDFDNHTSFELNIDTLEEIVSELSISKDIEFILCNNEEIKQINNQFRTINKATDVLSFPLENLPLTPLGSIIISLDYAKDISNDLGHSIYEEITLLFIHGLLHLIGMDHESDDGQMREYETKLIKQFSLPKSLIVRTEDKAS